MLLARRGIIRALEADAGGTLDPEREGPD
jgi:hypothetical protein